MDKNSKNVVLYFPFILLLCYLILMAMWRMLFICYNEVPDVFYPLFKAFRLDVSMTCGVFLAGFFLWFMFLITGWGWVKKLNTGFHIFLWATICLVELCSVLIYKEWGSVLDVRALSYLQHPKEAWASSKDFIPFPQIIIGLAIFVFGAICLFNIFKNWTHVKIRQWYNTLYIFLIAGLGILGLRGGWQKLPIVPSDSFYSKEMKNNFAATNKIWYFLYSVSHKTTIQLSNSEREIQAFQLKYLSDTLCHEKERNKWTNKNIVFVIFEGWSADMVKYLGGGEKVAPFFDSLSDYSIKFTNAFSTGFRTDQGLMSILSGVPSIQSINMPNVIDKVAHYPSLPIAIKSKRTECSFIYGGDLNFSNLYNYLTLMGFDTIISGKDFEDSDNITEWGVPDHIMLEKAVSVLNDHKELFFSTILLLSSHSPFEVPWSNEFSKKTDIPSRYKSSVRYSDESLRHFFRLAKNTGWYSNTLFVITSDHGSTHSGYAGMEDHSRFRIPLIFFDPAADATGVSRTIDIPCNHFDLPKTIISTIGGDDHNFVFGRDIFCLNPKRYAYWNVDVAAGSFGLAENSISVVSSHNEGNDSDAILFVDMIKKWFMVL